MFDAFYERDGDLFLATELTRGPWDPGAQHAGPPAALLGHAVERLPEAEAFQVGRITFEILRSVPIAPVRVEARLARPGRRVQMFEADLSDREGEVLVRARGWRIRTAPVTTTVRGASLATGGVGLVCPKTAEAPNTTKLQRQGIFIAALLCTRLECKRGSILSRPPASPALLPSAFPTLFIRR